MVSLVVFDLDGTLIDSRLDLANSTNEMLQSYGALPLPINEVAGMVGDGARILVERALAASGRDPHEPEALDRFRKIYDRRLLEHTVPYDGIVEVVARAANHGTSLGVLTNKPEAPTRRLLEAFALSRYFRWVVGGDSGFPRKPNPAGLLHIMSMASATPDRTLVVGDSVIDAHTARHAGVRMCVARYGFGLLRGEPVLDLGDLVAETPQAIGLLIERNRAV